MATLKIYVQKHTNGHYKILSKLSPEGFFKFRIAVNIESSLLFLLPQFTKCMDLDPH